VDNQKWVVFQDAFSGRNVYPNVPCHGIKVKGGEFGVSGAITPNWFVNLSYVYTQDKSDQYESGRTFELENGEFTETFGSEKMDRVYSNTYDNPKHLFKLTTSYKILDQVTFGGSWIWKSKLDYQADMSGESELELQRNQLLTQDAYQVVNLFGRYQVNPNLVVGLNVNNVFDEKYRVNWLGSYYGRNVYPNVPCHGIKVKGGEFGVSGAITPNWFVNLSYVYTQDKSDQYESGRTFELENGEFTETFGSEKMDRVYSNTYDNPKHLFKLTTSYKILDQVTFGGSWIWKSKLDYQADMSGESELELQRNQLLTQDAYQVVNLFGRYQVNPNLVVGLNVNNVFDEKYRVNWLGSYYGEPRNVMASLQLKY
ncbi:hypothetical protein GWI33_011005, partial [Rhynchophorus ferrugineus]